MDDLASSFGLLNSPTKNDNNGVSGSPTPQRRIQLFGGVYGSAPTPSSPENDWWLPQPKYTTPRPILPPVIDYARLSIPDGQQHPQYNPKYHHNSIAQTPIPADNTILTTIANDYSSNSSYLTCKHVREYYLSIACLLEGFQPSHLVILIGGCITPGGGIALEASTGAYVLCNPMGSPSFRYAYGALSNSINGA